MLIQELSSGTESHDLSKDEEASHKEELADTSKESGEYHRSQQKQGRKSIRSPKGDSNHVSEGYFIRMTHSLTYKDNA